MDDKIKVFQQIYSWLEDEESKYIYLNRLNFIISHDYTYMRNIINKYVPDMAALNDRVIPKLLKEIPKEQKFILYGAGEDARANLCYFINDERFLGFCDRDTQKQITGVDGVRVISSEQLLQDKACTIIISTHRGYDEIREFLLNNGVNDNRIYSMGPYMFAMQQEQYFNPNFMKFEEEEVFVDAGCCDLGTTLRLKQHCKKLKRVYAFEPDKSNYETCIKVAEKNFDKGVIRAYCKGTWSERKTLYFSATCDGSSRITENGDECIEVMTIDEAVDPCVKVTFIKMDVEGSELESLKGALNTIRRDKPKLAICIYHKPEDMYEIPLFIKNIVPEYKLYIRHHSNGDGETVLYAMP